MVQPDKLLSNLQSLDTEAFIDLITVEGSTFTPIRICNFETVLFDGMLYEKFPCVINSFAKSGEDTEVRSSLIISDISGLVGDIIDNAEIIGAKVNLKRTQSKFLDGQPTADSSQYFGFDMRINKYEGEYQGQFQFELVPYFSLERKKLPSRTYSRRCQWQLNMPNREDENCAAPLTVVFNGQTYLGFDINGNPTNDPSQRACKKDMAACKLYHGNTLRFGGFPAVSRIRG